MIVVACNSSSSYALKQLRQKFSVPIVGVIQSGAKKASLLTKNRQVGVIATTATVASGEYAKALKCYDQEIKVFSKACPLFGSFGGRGLVGKERGFGCC